MRHVIRVDRHHRRTLSLRVPPEAGQPGANMFDVGAMIADEQDHQRRRGREIRQRHHFSIHVRQPKIRGRRSQRQHG